MPCPVRDARLMTPLEETFRNLATELRSIHKLFDGSADDIVWGDDYEIAERSMALVDIAAGALEVVESAPEAALALCRSLIEHQALDCLIMLADKEQVEIRGVPRGDYDKWVQEGHAQFDDVTYKKEVLRFVRNAGYVPATDDGRPAEPISPYHRVKRDFSPGLPSANEGEQLLWQGPSKEGPRNWLEENARSYRQKWQWAAVQENLQLNDLISETHLLETRVHYAFLSQFTHSQVSGLFHRRSATDLHERRQRQRAKEMVLCYSLTMMRLQAENAVEFCRRRERLATAPLGRLVTTAEEAGRACSYFWFRGGSPTASDRRTEANHRAWHQAGYSWAPTGGRFEPVDAQELKVADMHYYSDPWRRLPQVSPFQY